MAPFCINWDKLFFFGVYYCVIGERNKSLAFSYGGGWKKNQETTFFPDKKNENYQKK